MIKERKNEIIYRGDKIEVSVSFETENLNHFLSEDQL